MVLTGSGGLERTKALDGTEVEGFGTCGAVLPLFIDPEVSLDPVVASFEVTDCALECLQ